MRRNLECMTRRLGDGMSFGDRKRVILGVKDKSKTIEIENFYQKDMRELFDVINKILNKDLQIKYKQSF
ncbi:hypothetical protein GA0116948_1284 [Chitinophaga costaii]|uniref:Uncharacterized protein n=2 Tax=Chitinophaga costaii TaxID=1335309 RepID=A0A1C4G7N4_9BACT|nr:hypothetical protein GA0116948_1284 [Chitinophaga costaii]